jgi:putative tryptophan/tyrosine transport system substrate-binding protein
MRRREFIAGLAGALWPLSEVRAQQVPVVGILTFGGPEVWAAADGATTHLFAALRQGLGEAGYVEGRNVSLVFRTVENEYDQFLARAVDLVDRKVDVIVATPPTGAALAAKAATTAIPIVFLTASDPVGIGLVASLNRPGGNVTGMTFLTEQLNAKRLEFLHLIAPAAATIAYVFNPNTPDDGRIGRMETAARVLGVRLAILNAATANEFEGVFAEIARQRIGALLIDSEPLFYWHRGRIAALATRYAVPAIYQTREQVTAGGLMSYGPSIPNAYRLGGGYVGRILNGEKPADLPVQQATKVELVVNLKTANALGLAFPLSLLGRADEVIE